MQPPCFRGMEVAAPAGSRGPTGSVPARVQEALCRAPLCPAPARASTPRPITAWFLTADTFRDAVPGPWGGSSELLCYGASQAWRHPRAQGSQRAERLKDQESFIKINIGKEGVPALCETIKEVLSEEVILKERHRNASRTNS